MVDRLLWHCRCRPSSDIKHQSQSFFRKHDIVTTATRRLLFKQRYRLAVSLLRKIISRLYHCNKCVVYQSSHLGKNVLTKLTPAQ